MNIPSPGYGETALVESPRISVVTIVSNNYLHFARTMLQSARVNNPRVHLFCAVVDVDESHAALLSTEFEMIALSELKLPLGDVFLFQYSILELNTAVKPWFIDYLLNRGYDFVFYIDPDIVFYDSLAPIERALSAGADVVLTPHLTAPTTDNKTPSELDLRRAGVFNLGFCAVKDSANTRAFVRWWQRKLTLDCVVDLEKGLFVDQSWIDLVPGMFNNVHIFRDPGSNVAYWNLAQRPIHKASDRTYWVGESPLMFFHFSGLNISDLSTLSRHQNRLQPSDLGVVTELVDDYRALLLKNGAEKYSSLEYGFGRFTSGDKISNEVRSLFRTSAWARNQFGPDPFSNPKAMILDYAEVTIDGISPTCAMMAFWFRSQDLQLNFRLNTRKSILDYYRWFICDPDVGDTFTQDVLSHHRKVLGENYPPYGNIEAGRGETRVFQLYESLLQRRADSEGFLVYGERCRSTLGFVVVWWRIAMSAESRSLPALLPRMIRALNLLG